MRLAFLFALFPGLALAEPAFEQHYAPSEDLEAIDVALIDSAGERIDMAAYVLTDLAVIQALTRAAERGVRVRVYRWREEHAVSGDVAQALAAMRAAGAEQRFKSPDQPLMHLKTYCLDGETLRFGAANFSHSGLTQQNNDLDISRGPHACDLFEAAFETMWRGE